MAKQSAGLVVYNYTDQNELHILLVHPGGPFWKNKDDGAWSIPKGEYENGEDPLEVAKREFFEETGNQIPSASSFLPLKPFKTKSGKTITAYAVKANFEKCFISSNYFEMEWPPKSGKTQSFPEVDNAKWFTIKEAETKINQSQLEILQQLELLIG